MACYRWHIWIRLWMQGLLFECLPMASFMFNNLWPILSNFPVLVRLQCSPKEREKMFLCDCPPTADAVDTFLARLHKCWKVEEVPNQLAPHWLQINREFLYIDLDSQTNKEKTDQDKACYCTHIILSSWTFIIELHLKKKKKAAELCSYLWLILWAQRSLRLLQRVTSHCIQSCNQRKWRLAMMTYQAF